MTFGLTGESGNLLRRLMRSPAAASRRARKTDGPEYLRKGENDSEQAFEDLLNHWTAPGSKVLRTAASREVEGAKADWDCILVAGTMHHKEQMQQLCQARELLKDRGKLILAGEYLRDVESIMKSSLPTEYSLLQLASRLGFCKLEAIDWTDNARQSLADAQALLAERLHKAMPPPANWLRSLLTSITGSRDRASAGKIRELARKLDALAAEFDAGHRRFECFVFELDSAAGGPWSELALGDIESFEPEEVAGIFEESFGTKFDPALWRWKYGAGKGTCIVARTEPGGPVIAHYGGVAREIDYFGADQLAFQGCDVMVKPEVRRQYGRNSLYFHMTATLFEREIGYTVDHVLGFGFPNEPVMKTAVRLGLYGKVDDYVELAFGDFPGPDSDIRAEALQLQNPRHRKSVDELWRVMRKDFGAGVIGKRHGDYLNYRYFQHPNAGAYIPLLLTHESEAFAVAVLKRHEEQWLLMDCVAPLARMNDVIAALRRWLDSRADSREEPGALRMWLTNAWVERLCWQDRVEKKLGIEIPFNAWNPGPDSTLPHGAWWLTAGDMDFM